MRERSEIEQEIEERRDDLAENIEELKRVVRDKVQGLMDRADVRRRAGEAVEKTRERIVEAAGDVRMAARERPRVFAAVAGGVLLTGILVMKVRRSRRRRREGASQE